MAIAQYPLPMDARVNEKVILGQTRQNPYEMRERVAADWTHRFTSDRRNARLSAVFALLGAIFTALAILL